MIRVKPIELAADARRALESLQDGIKRLPTYAERREAAKVQWKAKRRTAVFRTVEETLDAMCSGPRRCMYCEDNSARDIEHFRPHSIYPSLVFAWSNYLYACSHCNERKGQRFSVLSAGGAPVEIDRPLDEPEHGESVLLDPRHDEPMEYMQLDLRYPFYFRPVHPDPSPGFSRAERTIEWLGLNRRDDLMEARGDAYLDYRARLKEYVAARREGADEARLDRLSHAIQRKGHVTVWREMQRQRRTMGELTPLFEEAPEALGW